MYPTIKGGKGTAAPLPSTGVDDGVHVNPVAASHTAPPKKPVGGGASGGGPVANGAGDEDDQGTLKRNDFRKIEANNQDSGDSRSDAKVSESMSASSSECVRQ